MNEVMERPQAAAPVVRSESDSLTQAIIAAANDPSVNIEKMERLLSMHERIVARDAEQQFNAAMVMAQSKMGRVSADAVNPQTRSRYATYAQLDRTLRPVYTEAGFSLSFNSEKSELDGYVKVLCYVSHTAGHTRTYHCDMPADGKGAKGNDVMTKTHASGSAMTYGMRYLLKLIFNVAIGEDDDDGNAAGAGAAVADEFTQGWIEYVLSVKDTPEFTKAKRDAIAAINAKRDAAGLRAFNKAVSA